MTTVVVGAGIIGTTLAYELQKRGRQVVLVEKAEPGRGASFGNMACIAVTEFLPASRASIWKQLPRWMLDSQGPVCIRPGYLPQMLPFMWRFVAASRPARLRALERSGAALCTRVYEDLLPLLRETGLEAELVEEGCLAICPTPADVTAANEQLAILKLFGIPFERLGRDGIRALEPELSSEFGHAIHFPTNRSVRDPYRLVVLLAEAFVQRGGRIVNGEVTGVIRGAGVTAVRLHDGSTIEATEVVLCAGAHTGKLARTLGEALPLETERGYHTQILSPGIHMKHSVIWPSRGFMLTPTAGGIRIGGTVEFAGLHAAPDFRRAKAMVRQAQQALPNLRCETFTEWMGHRPALPDTIPVMSASARTRGLFYATGHGHLGLTYSATNARLMADLVTGRTPPIDMTPYRIDRF